MEPIAREFQVMMNFANPQGHVPEADRNNRVIKERVRASYHRFPYTHLSRMLVKILVTESTNELNLLPAKNGISQYYSPRMILHQRNLDYARHCQYAYGTYAQANDEPLTSNTNAPRSLDCIYLRYNDNTQGGHELLHLPIISLLTRRIVTPVPFTPAIIAQVHTPAVQEKMPEGLNISNRTGQLFYDSAWIAGVDYNADAFDAHDDDYSDDDQDSADSKEDYEGDYNAADSDDEHTETVDEVNHDDNDNDNNPEPEVNKTFELIKSANKDDESTTETAKEDEMIDEANPSTDADNKGPNIVTTRSGRVSKPPVKLTMAQYHLHTMQAHPQQAEYSIENARVIAMTMCCVNEMFFNPYNEKAHQFVQSYSLARGKLGQRGRDAAYKEMKQLLHDRVVFAEPIMVESLTELEKRRAMESLIFLLG